MLSQEDIILIMSLYKSKSFSQAAKILYLGQSTLSKKIQIIEDELGYKIFNRGKGKKNIELTENGNKLLPILREIDILTDKAKKLGYGKSKYKLRIASSDSPYISFIDDIILDLYKNNPNWEFKLKSLSFRECIDVLIDNIVDISFVGNNIYKKELNIFPLYSEKMVFICAKNKKYQKYTSKISLSELNLEKAIYSSYSSDFSSWFRKTFNNEQPLIVCDSVIQVIRYISELNLWSIVPISVADYISQFIDINVIQINEYVPDRIIYYAIKAGEISEAVREMIKLMKKKLETKGNMNSFL